MRASPLASVPILSYICLCADKAAVAVMQPQAVGIAQKHLHGKAGLVLGQAERECPRQPINAPSLEHLPRQEDMCLEQVMWTSSDSIFCLPCSTCESHARQHDTLAFANICKRLLCLKWTIQCSHLSGSSQQSLAGWICWQESKCQDHHSGCTFPNLQEWLQA